MFAIAGSGAVTFVGSGHWPLAAGAGAGVVTLLAGAASTALCFRPAKAEKADGPTVSMHATQDVEFSRSFVRGNLDARGRNVRITDAVIFDGGIVLGGPTREPGGD